MQHRSQSSAPAKHRRIHLLTTLLALAALMLVIAACGGRRATPEAPATPTLIPTLAALEPAAAATPEPAATEAAAATEEVAAAEPLTATEEITAAEEATATEAVTSEATTEVTPSEEISGTEAATAAEAVTATEELTAAAEVTSAEEATAAEEVTSTQAVTATEEPAAAIGTGEEMTSGAELTATETLTAGAEMTPAAEMTETAAAGHVHGATATATPSASETITAAGEITTTEELTATRRATATAATTGTQGAAALLPATGQATGKATEEAATGEGRVFFLQPTTNAVIPITSTVVIGYEGVEVQAAGAVQEGAGHLHILVDEDFIEAGQGMPADAGHLHLGDGSAETELVLTPGSHVLRLQFANGAHIALAGDQYRDEIYVNVIDGAPEESVRFAMPTDGAVVPPTFDVVLAASGLSVQPSGAAIEDAGHLHLLLDQDFVAAGDVISEDDSHLYFGEGQLTGTVTLEPGEHTLRLQYSDGDDRALDGDQYHSEITVTVDENAEATRVLFVAPEDGATVTAPFTITWAAAGVIVESAGQVVRPEGGHLHLLINQDFVPAGQVIPTSANSLHFGRGQISAELDLNPGEYTFRLQMADGAHIAKEGDQYRDEINITVQ